MAACKNNLVRTKLNHAAKLNLQQQKCLDKRVQEEQDMVHPQLFSSEGGVVHGPVVRFHSHKLPKKIRVLGLKSILSQKQMKIT